MVGNGNSRCHFALRLGLLSRIGSPASVSEVRARAFFIGQRERHYALLNQNVFKKLQDLAVEPSFNPFVESLKSMSLRLKRLEKMTEHEREEYARKREAEMVEDHFVAGIPQMSVLPWESVMATRTAYMDDAERHLAADWPELPSGIRETIRRMDTYNSKVMECETGVFRRVKEMIDGVMPKSLVASYVHMTLHMAIETEMIVKVWPECVPMTKQFVPLSRWTLVGAMVIENPQAPMPPTSSLPSPEVEEKLKAAAAQIAEDPKNLDMIRSLLAERNEIVKAMNSIAQYADSIAHRIESFQYDRICTCCPQEKK